MKKIIFLWITLLSFSSYAQEMPEHILKLLYTGNIISRFYVDDAHFGNLVVVGIIHIKA